MTISAISNAQPAQAQVKNTQKHSYFNPANITGYATLASGVGSVIAIKNKSFKWHKYLAYASGALALAHIGLIEWFHNKKKNSNNNVN